jgi:lysophospholipase L1-like esterase
MVPVNEAQMPFLGGFYYSHTEQALYNRTIRTACHQHQIPHLDLFSIWLARGERWWGSRLSGDGLHPNVAGYEALLEDILGWDALAQLA